MAVIREIGKPTIWEDVRLQSSELCDRRVATIGSDDQLRAKLRGSTVRLLRNQAGYPTGVFEQCLNRYARRTR